MDIQTPPTSSSRLLTEYYGALFFLMVLAFLLIAVFFLKPMLEQVKATNANIAATLQMLDVEKKYVLSLDQSVVAAQSISSKVLTNIDRALPRTDDVPQLLVLFDEAAARNHLRISSISFSDDTASVAQRLATSSIAETTIQVSIAGGDYARTKKFIRDIESSLRLLDITGITVSSQGVDAVYALQIKTYSYHPQGKTTSTAPAS